MAAIAAKFNQDDLMRRAVVNVEIVQTPPRRMGFALGLALVRIGLWLIGVGGVEVRVKDQC